MTDEVDQAENHIGKASHPNHILVRPQPFGRVLPDDVEQTDIEEEGRQIEHGINVVLESHWPRRTYDCTDRHLSTFVLPFILNNQTLAANRRVGKGKH